jgi:uncharacterized protein (TIGR03086 family)
MDDPFAAIGDLSLESIGLLVDAVAAIAPEAWENPSNLEGWTVRELVGHATGSAAKIVALLEGAEIWRGPSQPDDWITAEPEADLRELSARMRNALPGADFGARRPSPGGEVALRRALGFPVADLALHSWDLHRSQGRLTELPDEILMLTWTLVGALPEDAWRRPGAFGPAQPAPENATPTTALMAFLGRSV